MFQNLKEREREKRKGHFKVMYLIQTVVVLIEKKSKCRPDPNVRSESDPKSDSKFFFLL